MRLRNISLIAVLAPILWAAGPENATLVKETFPEVEKKDNTVQHFDYSIPLKAFTHHDQTLNTYQNKNLLVFYFSATCPHCQQAIPTILDLSKDLRDDELNCIAVASGSNDESDIAEFISTYKVDIPVFQDEARKMSKSYGTGSVPLVLMVKENGEYYRLKKYDKETTPDLIRTAYADSSNF